MGRKGRARKGRAGRRSQGVEKGSAGMGVSRISWQRSMMTIAAPRFSSCPNPFSLFLLCSLLEHALHLRLKRKKEKIRQQKHKKHLIQGKALQQRN